MLKEGGVLTLGLAAGAVLAMSLAAPAPAAAGEPVSTRAKPVAAAAETNSVPASGPDAPSSPVPGIDQTAGPTVRDVSPPPAAPPPAGPLRPVTENKEGGRATGSEAGAPQKDTAAILAKLHHLNEMEIALGTTAHLKGASPATKQFGSTLVDDHRAADRKVVALARQRGLGDDQLQAASEASQRPGDREQLRADAERLDRVSGPAFDRTFATMMEEGHREAIAMVRAARDVTDDPELKSLLRALVPTLERHHQTAEMLAGSAPAQSKH